MASNQQRGGQQQPQGQMVPFKAKMQDFRSFLEKGKTQLAHALPKHITPDRVLRLMLTEAARTPKLLECSRDSVWGAVLQCAQLGLEPGGVLGQAYLVPFMNRKAGRLECQLIPGYKGLIKLAYQSGEVGAIRARIVREKDRFSYEYGINERLEHVPYRGDDPGDMVAVYAVAKIKGIDEPQFLVIEAWEMGIIRSRSKSANDGPWVTDPPEMWKKSALRRLCKLLPASTEKDNLARAVALDEAAEAPDMDQGDFIDVPALEAGQEEQQRPVSKLDELAEKKRRAQQLNEEEPPPPDDDEMPGWASGPE